MFAMLLLDVQYFSEDSFLGLQLLCLSSDSVHLFFKVVVLSSQLNPIQLFLASQPFSLYLRLYFAQLASEKIASLLLYSHLM